MACGLLLLLMASVRPSTALWAALGEGPLRAAAAVLSLASVAWAGAVCSPCRPRADSLVTRLDGTKISGVQIDSLVTHWMRTAHVTGVGIAIVNRDLANDPRYEQITLRMFLDQTSGLPNWRRSSPDHKLRILFQPGSRFNYSREGYYLAQLVVESVTKQPIRTPDLHVRYDQQLDRRGHL